MKTLIFIVASIPSLAFAAEQQQPRFDQLKTPPVVLKPSQPKACAKFGEGWVQLQGSDTCVKLGGYVRIDAAH